MSGLVLMVVFVVVMIVERAVRVINIAVVMIGLIEAFNIVVVVLVIILLAAVFTYFQRFQIFGNFFARFFSDGEGCGVFINDELRCYAMRWRMFFGGCDVDYIVRVVVLCDDECGDCVF